MINSPANSYTVGKKAENEAMRYLKQFDWQIIANNYKTRYGEIDILATKDDILVAFEVKTRKNLDLLYYSIVEKQQKRIADTLLYFLNQNPQYNNFTLRFDALLINSINAKITHITNAWST